MKKLIILFPIFVLSMSIRTNAQSTPVVDGREQNQRARIREGVADGSVTHTEASHLRGEQRHIKRSEKRAKADGNVSKGERARIKHKQTRASRDIRRQKHDNQTRNRAE